MATAEAAVKPSEGWLERLLGQGIQIRAETLVYAALLLAAVVTRFYDLETRVMSHDESLHTFYSWELFKGRGFQHTPLMHGPLQFHLVALSYFLFGDSDATARVPAALSGVLAVGMLFLYRRWLGRTGALVAAGLLLISPYMLYYSRYVRNESYVVAEALLAYWATFRYFETRQPRWLTLMAFAWSLHFITKETSFIYAAQALSFFGAYLAWQLARRRWANDVLRALFLVGLAATALGSATALVSYFQGRAAGAAVSPAPEALAPLDPEAISAPTAGLSPSVAVGGGLALAGLVLIGAALIGEFGGRLRTEFPVLDAALVLGTLTLPQLGAIPSNLLGWDPLAYQDTTAFNKTVAVVTVLVLVAAAVGVAWDWRRWVSAALAFYVPYVIIYTTLFTNGQGIATGLVGSLGYWLVQHGVERGSQPYYYYALVQVPVYEFLPAIGALLALWYALRGRRPTGGVPLPTRGQAQPAAALGQRQAPDFPVLVYMGYWAATALLAYSFAGERMPWLTVHIALPLILLSGWSIGRYLTALDWGQIRQGRGWLSFLLALVLILSLARTLGSLLGPNPPFRGQELDQLAATSQFLAALFVAAGSGAGLFWLTGGWSPRAVGGLAGLAGLGLLTLLTVRASFRASYANYDQATEFMVYAHAATGVKTVMDQIEDLSMRTTDGLAIQVAYDDDVSWPIHWYMRNYTQALFYGANPSRDLVNYPVVIAGDSNYAKVDPLLAPTHRSFEYIRMWWPMQEYFGLTWTRVFDALSSPEYRGALWDIWLNRDYTAYGELTGGDYSLERWNPSDRMKLYLRSDIAALVWDYGVTPAALEPVEYVDPYLDGMADLNAVAVVGSSGAGPGQFSRPRGVAIAPDGSLYVADTLNHRIQHLTPQGEVLHQWGEFCCPADPPQTAPPGTFNEPWGLALAPDGSVYVADTWNHRVQHFSGDGQFLGSFGVFGQAESAEAFWGPRAVAVDPQGRVYVADTGNKRVVVFDDQETALGSFGGFGLQLGGMDEPVGVALGADGLIYVADTWNQRVQVFQTIGPGDYTPVAEWDISGWFGQSLDNKPYLAVGPDGQVCASDPEGFRVLCFEPDGEFRMGWGGFGTDGTQLGLVSGLAFDALGGIWVVDTGNDRLLRFEP
jgi:uncharacterized protein (TIGR03663 family)